MTRTLHLVADLEELLSEADIITVHTPLTEETRHMIGAREIAQMKDRVILINCARGGIYDEQALSDALASGKVAGAGIDVYSSEPPRSDPLLIRGCWRWKTWLPRRTSAPTRWRRSMMWPCRSCSR